MPIGDALTLSYPTGVDNMATVVAKIKTILETYEAILESDIDSGSLDITTALSLGGTYLYNLIRVVLSGVSTPPTDVGSIYTDSDGDLHVVTPDGDVKLTLNGQLNAASTGAIVGDYGAGDEAVYYDQVSGEYRFWKDNSPETWATLIAKAFKAVKDSGAAGSAKFGVDASVSTDLVFELKTLPGSGVGGLAYEASSNGVVDASVTRETLAHKFTDIDMTGSVDMTTGKINHGDKYIGLAPMGFFSGAGSGSPGSTDGAPSYALDTSGGILKVPTFLKPGDRIKSIRVAFTSPGGAPTVRLKHCTFTTPYSLSITPAVSTTTEFSTTLKVYTVDTPDAIGVYDASGTGAGPFFARNAVIEIEAASNTTVIKGISVVYDSIGTIPSA